MPHPSSFVPFALALGLLAPTGTATAQRAIYRCMVDGRAIVSDRPCTGGAATGLGSIGETREAREGRTYRSPSSSDWRDPPKAAEHLQYLSPLCSEMREGLRNGPARGLGSRAMGELQTSYQEKCGEEDRRARSRLSEDQGRAREARSAQERADRLEAERVKVSREQCDEMYRIVATRRKRVEAMSSAERADFERFQANWKSRCNVG